MPQPLIDLLGMMTAIGIAFLADVMTAQISRLGRCKNQRGFGVSN